jgi:hypothetical protein
LRRGQKTEHESRRHRANTVNELFEEFKLEKETREALSLSGGQDTIPKIKLKEVPDTKKSKSDVTLPDSSLLMIANAHEIRRRSLTEGDLLCDSRFKVTKCDDSNIHGMLSDGSDLTLDEDMNIPAVPKLVVEDTEITDQQMDKNVNKEQPKINDKLKTIQLISKKPNPNPSSPKHSLELNIKRIELINIPIIKLNAKNFKNLRNGIFKFVFKI